MKSKSIMSAVLLGVAITLTSMASIAADSTAPPTLAGVIPVLITGVLVPFAIAGLKRVLPSLPGWVLPIIATAGPALVDAVALALNTNLVGNPALAAIGGALGIGVREVFDQAVRPIFTKVDMSTTVKALAVAAVSAFLISCTSNSLVQLTPKTPQQAVDSANVLITATAEAATENVRAGIMTEAERDAVSADLKKYRETTKEAQSLIDLGKGSEAQIKVNAITAALTALQKRVAAKAREDKKT